MCKMSSERKTALYYIAFIYIYISSYNNYNNKLKRTYNLYTSSTVLICSLKRYKQDKVGQLIKNLFAFSTEISAKLTNAYFVRTCRDCFKVKRLSYILISRAEFALRNNNIFATTEVEECFDKIPAGK